MPAKIRLTSTPYFDAWRAAYLSATAGRGAKAALARHMAALTGQSLAVWTVSLAKLARPGSMLNAEYLLAIQAWMDSKTHPARPRTPPATPAK